MPLVSIVIRTLNEEKHLPELLQKIKQQDQSKMQVEVVLVDSGSTDKTLEIAKKFKCRITHIKKENFTFGRSLNYGINFAKGDYLVFISGHCIPVEDNWVEKLVQPLVDGVASYSYGRQVARDTTKFSEKQIFDKFYPTESKIPQEGFFCNNANAAIKRADVPKNPYNEELTGLEDMYLVKQLVEKGRKVAYVAEAPVYHIHDETWAQVKRRYEREAIALQEIMPNVHFTLTDFIKYTASSVVLDFKEAAKRHLLIKNFSSIIMFRVMQYWGTYRGNRDIREISAEMKMRYFYPTKRM